MTKYVYVVTGSEDGTFAVCGARRTAAEKALWYVDQHGEYGIRTQQAIRETITEIGNGWTATVYGPNGSATIEKMPLE